MPHSLPAPSAVYDGGALACRDLLGELDRRLLPLPAGAVLLVLSDDPVAPLDLQAWCDTRPVTYLGEAAHPGRPAYYLRKD